MLCVPVNTFCEKIHASRVKGMMGMLRISEAREARGWTQTQLAQAIGTTQQTVQRWESGQVDPKISQVEAVSNALGITMSFLLGVDEPKRPEMSAEDTELLELFHSMSAQGRANLIEQAEFLAARHPLNQALGMGA